MTYTIGVATSWPELLASTPSLEPQTRNYANLKGPESRGEKEETDFRLLDPSRSLLSAAPLATSLSRRARQVAS
jgi:hypothetical protein